MKKAYIFNFLIIISLILLPGSVFSETIGKITFPLGDVYYLAPEGTKWKTAEFNQDVEADAKLKTEAESRCEITLNDGSVIRIGENSILNLGNSTVTPELKIIKTELEKGKVWLNIRKLQSSLEKVELYTPTAVAAIRGTIYRSEVDTSSTELRVYDGKVKVNFSPEVQQKIQEKEQKLRKPGRIEGPKRIQGPKRVSMAEWLEIVAGEQVIIDREGRMQKSRFDPDKDSALDWVKWNKERDSGKQR